MVMDGVDFARGSASEEPFVKSRQCHLTFPENSMWYRHGPGKRRRLGQDSSEDIRNVVQLCCVLRPTPANKTP